MEIEKKEIEKESFLCSACLLGNETNEINELSHTLWGFNPYSYSSYKELKTGLSQFIFTHYYNKEKPSSFYNSLNEDGYTFSQWNIYYLSKNDTKSKRLHLQTMWLFYILAEYPFFPSLIRHGKRDDPHHHTLHHFMSYLEKYGCSQKKLTGLLLYHGLTMNDVDGDGNTPSTLLLQTEMSKEDIVKCKQLTHAYKELEKICLNPLQPFIRKCRKCNEPVGLFDDITTHFDKIQHLSDLITEMTFLREDCNNIYKKYGDTQSVQRHQYVVDLYRSLLLSSPQATQSPKRTISTKS